MPAAPTTLAVIAIGVAILNPGLASGALTPQELFLHSWEPEYSDRQYGPSARENAFMEVAELARRGAFKQAADSVAKLKSTLGASSDQELATLFERRLEQERLSLSSGSRSAHGDLHLELLLRGSLPDGAAGGPIGASTGATETALGVSGASPLSFLLSFCLSTLPSEVPANNSGLGGDAVRQAESFYRESADFCGRSASALDFEHEETARLLRMELRGELAAARRSFVRAKQYFEAGVSAATAAGRARLAGRLELRLGDLVLTPYGSAEALGFNLLGVDDLAIALGRGLYPEVTAAPTRQDIEYARRYYLNARDRFEATGHIAGLVQLAIRDAYLSYLTEGPNSSAAFEAAATYARSVGYIRIGDLAQGYSGILTGDVAALNAATTSLLERTDLGSAVSLLATARAVAIVAIGHGDHLPAWRALRAASGSITAKLPASSAAVLGTHADLFDRLGRIDAAIVQSAKAASLQQEFLASAVTRFGDDSPLAEGASGNLSTRIANLIGLLAVFEVPDDAADRLNMSNRALRYLAELEATLGDSLADGFRTEDDLLDQQAERLLDQFRGVVAEQERLRNVRKKLQHSQGCPDSGELAALRSRIFGESSLLTVGFDVAVARCGPEHWGATQQHYPDLSARLAVALSRGFPSATPSASSLGEAAMFVSRLEAQNYLELAAAAGDVELLESLLSETQTFARTRSIHSLDLRPYWLKLAILQRRLDDAQTLMDELVPTVTNTGGFDFDVRLSLRRSSVWSMFVHLAALKGSAPDAVWGIENLAWEARARSRLSTGLQRTNRSGAELAKLRRDRIAALLQSPPDESTFVADRFEELAESEAAVQIEPPPTRSEVERAFDGVEATVVVFHFGDQPLSLQFDPGAPAKLNILKPRSSDIMRRAAHLREKLSVPEKGWQSDAIWLYNELIEPLGELEPGHPLIFLGAGPLGGAPLGALISPEGQLLGVERPITEVDRLAHARDIRASPSLSSSLVVGVSGGTIPNTISEAEGVAKSLSVDPLLETEASLDRTLSLIPAADILHFATHGVIDPVNPYRSRLILADQQELEAWQLFETLGNPYLVVLSACDTNASFDYLRGGAVQGLAFFATESGSQWVVSSLWNARDRAALQVMERFYEGLVQRRLRPDVALWRAKQALAEQFHPSSFSNFVISAPSLLSFEP